MAFALFLDFYKRANKQFFNAALLKCSFSSTASIILMLDIDWLGDFGVRYEISGFHLLFKFTRCELKVPKLLVNR